MDEIVQFYNVETNVAYCGGHPFPYQDGGIDYPEGSGWVAVISKKRVAISTLRKKAKKLDNDDSDYPLNF